MKLVIEDLRVNDARKALVKVEDYLAFAYGSNSTEYRLLEVLIKVIDVDLERQKKELEILYGTEGDV